MNQAGYDCRATGKLDLNDEYESGLGRNPPLPLPGGDLDKRAPKQKDPLLGGARGGFARKGCRHVSALTETPPTLIVVEKVKEKAWWRDLSIDVATIFDVDLVLDNIVRWGLQD